VIAPLPGQLAWAPGGAALGRVVRAGWHLASPAWVGPAGALATGGGAGLQLAVALVAALSGLAIFAASRGRHAAWVLFALTALWLLRLHGPAWLPRGSALACALALGGLCALHLAWAAGLRRGLAAALPTRADGTRALQPSLAATGLVALALAAAAALALMAGGFLPGPPLARPLGWAAAVAFAARAVGDFRYAGFFKRHRGSPFARLDDWLFTPLCVALSAGFTLALA
jgi:hypothetical protein